MKLIIAVINHDDAPTVISRLTEEGLSVTKLATTGGFLRAGNVTILIGIEEERVRFALDLISEYSHSRKGLMPTAPELGLGIYPAFPVEVTVGGATVFVVDIEQFLKL